MAYVDKAGHQSIESVISDAMTANKMIGVQSGGGKVVQVPSVSRAADPAAWKAFDEATGVPADGKYGEFKPDTGNLMVSNEHVAALDQAMHAAGAPPAARDAALSAYHQLAAADEAANEAAWTRECTEGNAKLKAEWGDKFDPNVKIADRAIEDHLGDDFMKLLQDTRINEHPLIREAGYKLALKFADSTLTPAADGAPASGGMTKASAEKELGEIEASDAFKKGDKRLEARRVELLGIIG